MNITTDSKLTKGHRYGNPTVDCNGAQIHKQCRQLATVLTVTGVIDELNVDVITAQAKSCVIPEKPFILDLSGVTSFAGHGIALFDAVDEVCTTLGEEWSVIASQPVSRALRLCGIDGAVPTASSVPDALHHFSDVRGRATSAPSHTHQVRLSDRTIPC